MGLGRRWQPASPPKSVVGTQAGGLALALVVSEVAKEQMGTEE